MGKHLKFEVPTKGRVVQTRGNKVLFEGNLFDLNDLIDRLQQLAQEEPEAIHDESDVLCPFCEGNAVEYEETRRLQVEYVEGASRALASTAQVVESTLVCTVPDCEHIFMPSDGVKVV